MKTRFILTIGAILTAGIILTGCATPQITPGAPAQPAITNAATGAITAPLAASPALTNYTSNATLVKYVGEAQTVTPLLPAPYGAAADEVLKLLLVGAGIVAMIQTKRKNKSDAVATSIIQGVESAGSAAAAVKLAVASVSKANGVSDLVEAAVNKVTGAQ